MLWDDDFLLDPLALRETAEFVESGAAGCLRLLSRFHWDEHGTVNDAFPAHWAHWVWRHRPGATYTPRLMIHAPEAVVLAGPVRDMAGRADNYGYLTAEDRARTWEAYRRAGKIDAHTLCFAPSAHPKLRKL
jgi:hypothetical protein